MPIYFSIKSGRSIIASLIEQNITPYSASFSLYVVVTAGTAMYGLTELGGLVAGESVVVTGPGPIGLMGVAVAKALGAQPVILTGTRDNRLEIGKKLGADYVINVKNENVVSKVREIKGLIFN